MNIKVLAALLLCWWGLLLPMAPDHKQNKIINLMKELNEALIGVINHPNGTKKQCCALERAKVLVQEGIVVHEITDNPTLYSIGAILLNDPVYAARATLLQKERDSARRNTEQLIRKEHHAMDEAEKYIHKLDDEIEEIEMILMSPSLNSEARANYELRKTRLERTKKWAQAQSLAHGMLKEAMYRYKNLKDEGSSSSLKGDTDVIGNKNFS